MCILRMFKDNFSFDMVHFICFFVKPTVGEQDVVVVSSAIIHPSTHFSRDVLERSLYIFAFVGLSDSKVCHMHHTTPKYSR